ncbi:hypothetical protein VF14_24525 [Nostoc linckia z18]|uniref:Uncharacterized protein n=2 Tax=Nostoc linckia TaxID=92942 RepID=A0A9Q5Z950_NOSLI|nr:hypothetical protein [Nostoc linckia]PHK38799.1 hypothetical protein VF12_16885 [Nostoc linckia z15]PHK44317.1 hypothetical protein VF13_22565 [Nostoc linckia z16]PHJ62797.1 hypothetical protein VF02_16745 [Nostoc linckia z1]PHJ66627.1 hypothetical protein VF05_19020 [Nostoc linckia z3]PHJ72748.1 hypothetical protein VF03_18120 [Nostoc linckia z2]
MTFQCDGEQKCEAGNMAIVEIQVKSNPYKKLEVDSSTTPLCVKKDPTEVLDPLKKCYRFSAASNGVDTFEHFVCAREAHYQSDPSLQRNGAWLIADGVRQNGVDYSYWSGSFAGDTYTRKLEIVDAVQVSAPSSTGGCNCTKTVCKVSISGGSNSEIHQSEHDEPCSDITVKVGCDGCPEGSHKCTHNKYPGYCCVPCKEVGNRIKNIASKVRG